MTRFDLLTVLLQALGVLLCVYGLAALGQAFWFYEMQSATRGVGVSLAVAHMGYYFATPGVQLIGGLALIFGSRPVALLCGERPRPN